MTAASPIAQPTSPTVISRVFNTCIAVAAFLLSCTLLHRVLPPPRIPQISAKLDYFASHKDELDAVFIGSSRFRRHISPLIFDRVMAESGVPTRTFNFGVDAMHPPESFYVLDQILATQPGHLKWVFIELNGLHTHWSQEFYRSERLVYWHDWPRTLAVLQKLLGTRGKVSLIRLIRRAIVERDTTASHLSLWVKKFSNFGRGSAGLTNLGESEPENVADTFGPQGDGWSPIDGPQPNKKPERADESTDVQQAKAPRSIDDYAVRMYSTYADRIRSRGAVPVFVVPPVVGRLPVNSSAGAAADILAFDDPAAYPNLFRADVRIDVGHMNRTGAEQFSRLLAQRFVADLHDGRIR
jgi:hypothetical protein